MFIDDIIELFIDDMIELFIDDMIVRIISLVLLFIIRIRFLRGKLIADIIRNRYGEATVKKIRRFKKCVFKLQKYDLDLRFLLACKNSTAIPKFLRFKLANRHLKLLMCTKSAKSD